MKAKKSKAATVLLVIAALFLIYGIYAVINAVNYVNTYTTASTITTMGSIHYIVTSSMAYFGFASILIAASLILKNQASISGNSEDPSDVRKDSKDVQKDSIPPVTSSEGSKIQQETSDADSSAFTESQSEKEHNEAPVTTGSVTYDKPVDSNESTQTDEPLQSCESTQIDESDKPAESSPAFIDVKEAVRPFKYHDTVPLKDELTKEIENDIDRVIALLRDI